MLYDKKIHLPQINEKMLEDFRTGNISQLEADKILIQKIFYDNKDFNQRIKLIEKKYDENKKNLVVAINGKQKELEEEAGKLDSNERDYWESIIGLTIRTIDSIPSLAEE